MHQLDLRRLRIPRQRALELAFAGVWFGGIFLGLLASGGYGGILGDLARSAGISPPEFRDACMAAVIPVFFAAFAVYFLHRTGVFLACGLRGLLVGFTLGVLADTGGVWLCGLLFFSGLFGSAVVLWFLWRRLRLGMLDFREDLIFSALGCVVLAALDTWVTAPFLAAALTY